MRVVHLSKVTGIAGAEGHLLRLLPGLKKRQVDVHMLVLEEPHHSVDSFCDRLLSSGISTERISIRGHLDLSLLSRLRSRFAALRPDIVHTHLIHADLYGLLAARQAEISHRLSSRHNDDAFRRHPAVKVPNRWAMSYADRILTISHALARFVAQVEGINQQKIVTVHYGLEACRPDPSARVRIRTALGYSLDDQIIGVGGRLIRQKGIDVLLRAFPDVLKMHPGARLLIGGDGPERQALETLAAQLEIAEPVYFAGWVENAAESLTPACDVVVVPSRWEGFGLVTLEAMASALPVIASRTSALPEIVVDGETGLLVPPDEPAALAHAINALLSDPVRAAQFGEAGYQRLISEFSVDKMVCATLDLYEELTGRGVR